VLSRLVVVIVGVAVVAWLGVMERDARLQARGSEAAGRSGPASFARADADLRGARFLNPDTGPDQIRAFLYQGRGEVRRAAALAQDVVRREPDNVAAWRLVLAFAGSRDSPARRQALAALRRLDPLDAQRH
jgi:hypothetical protein